MARCPSQALFFLTCLGSASCHIMLISSADSSEGLVIMRAALSAQRENKSTAVSVIAGVDDLSSKNTDILRQAGVEIRHLDSSKAVARSVFAGVDIVFLLPPLTDDRAERTSRIVEAAIAADVPHALLLSVMGADRGLQSMASYMACEDHVRAAWPKLHSILRTTFYVQNLLLWAPSVASHKHLMLPFPSDAHTAPLFESDVAAVALAVADAPDKSSVNGTFNLTGLDLLTGVELARHLSIAIGFDVVFDAISKKDVISMLSDSAPSLSSSERSLLADLASIPATKVSPVIQTLAHRRATSVDVFFTQNKKAFTPEGLKKIIIL